MHSHTLLTPHLFDQNENSLEPYMSPLGAGIEPFAVKTSEVYTISTLIKLNPLWD